MTSPALSSALEVPVDRRRIDRLWVPIIIVLSLVVLAEMGLTILATVLATADGQQFLLVVVPQLFLLGYTGWLLVRSTRTWRRSRGLGPVLRLDADGLTLATPHGHVRAGWDAVVGVHRQPHLFGTRLVVRFVPDGDPRRAGLVIDGLTSRERRFLDRVGLTYSLRALAVDPDRLLWAFLELSGRRVVPIG